MTPGPATRERDLPASAVAAATVSSPKPPLTLCFGVHDHQPAANFDYVFEQAADEAYLPFLTAAARHPEFRISLHVSGGLLIWLEKHRPRGVDLIGDLVERGQVEMMGGGFYEPILPSVPVRDALGQLEKLSDHLERRFGRRPLGAWVAERVWEGAMAAVLARAGFRYTVLDDNHFLRAGLTGETLRGFFVTEREGLPLFLFPIDQGLRYVLPFQPVESVVARLREMHVEAADAPAGRVPCVTYADDGEKFGLWPGTRAWVYGEGWLDRFLDALGEESGWLRTSTFAEALLRFPPGERVYLPEASYREMTEWALPTPARLRLERAREALPVVDSDLAALLAPFLAGGIWPQFLAKYPEANLMHKKMLWVSDLLDRGDAGAAGVMSNRGAVAADDSGDPLAAARELLYRAQSNCSYWHGVFGGLYLGHLRHAVFADLLAAEDLLAPVETPTLQQVDFDRDGEEELWLRVPAANLLIAPHRGGGIPLFELREPRMNLTNVITRRPEAYHDEIRKAAREGTQPQAQAARARPRRRAPGRATDGAPSTIHAKGAVPSELARELVYDPYPRLSALEHVVAGSLTLAAFQGTREPAPQQVALPRYAVRERTAGTAGARVLLARGEPHPMTKEVLLEAGGSMRVGWTLERAAADAWFVAEWSLFFFSGKDPGRRYLMADGKGPMLRDTLEVGETEAIGIVDEPMGLAVELSSPRPFRLWAFPLNTVSRGEGGFESTYQGTCLALGWPLDEREFSVALRWRRP